MLCHYCCSLSESFSFLLSISFPDPNGTQRKGTVFITGTVDSVIHARAQLLVRNILPYSLLIMYFKKLCTLTIPMLVP